MGLGTAGYVLVAWAHASVRISADIERKVAAPEADNPELGEEEPGVLEVVLEVVPEFVLVRRLSLGRKCRLSP